MKVLVALVCALAISTPLGAQTVEELQAQLAAQEQISELLRERIRILEADAASRASGAGTAPVPAARLADAPGRAADDPEEDRALERALVRRGNVVLGAYVAEITPSAFWSHSGRDSTSSTDDLIGTALDARIGLPGGWMIGGRAPLLYRSVDGSGDNTGIGDISATVWKEITGQDGDWPSLVGSLRYTAPTGEDFSDTAVPLGSGFHRLAGRLSAVKTVDPIAFFGNVSYSHNFTRSFGGVEVNRSGVFGVGAGASLAVTPDIPASAGLSFAFEGAVKLDGSKISGSGTTVGVVDLGLGIVLSKGVFLNFTGGFSITEDSPDVTLGVSMPVRF
ncbi:MAG: hypothetical protein ACTSUD_07700 [Alphaproteobacteria bacterium]